MQETWPMRLKKECCKTISLLLDTWGSWMFLRLILCSSSEPIYVSMKWAWWCSSTLIPWLLQTMKNNLIQLALSKLRFQLKTLMMSMKEHDCSCELGLKILTKIRYFLVSMERPIFFSIHRERIRDIMLSEHKEEN